MLNIPLTDVLAVRVNAGWSHDAGFINYPNLYVLDSNGAPVSADPGNPFSAPGQVLAAGSQFLRLPLSAGRRALEAERELPRATVLLLSTIHGRRISVCRDEPGSLQSAHQSGRAARG